MAEQPNGIVSNGDVEMKEEAPAEVSARAQSDYASLLHSMLMDKQASLSNIEQAVPQDSTDSTLPPQPATNPTIPPQQPEHLSSIAPAVATPPASTAPARPGSMPPQPTARPEKPVAHGGPTRQFLNSNVTPHLLEGMKYLAAYEPEKPLQWLSDFLRDRSKEIEGS